MGLTALTELAHAHAPGARPQSSATWQPKVFTAHHNETITLTELIIPETDTAGAKTAEVNVFIDTILNDAGTTEREAFLRGLSWIDDRSRELFDTSFITAEPSEQTALLTVISSEDNRALSERVGVEFFQTLKQLPSRVTTPPKSACSKSSATMEDWTLTMTGLPTS